MIFCDVNVLVYAFREDSPHHRAYHAWLTDKLAGDESLAVNAEFDSSFLRIVTHPRIYSPPSAPETAFAFLRDLRESPVATPLRPGPRHWEIFERLCLKAGARGNLVPDAYLAALAIESGSTLYSADRGLARFPDLRWRHPMDELGEGRPVDG